MSRLSVLSLLVTVFLVTPVWANATKTQTPTIDPAKPAQETKAVEPPSPETIRHNLDIFESKHAWLAMAIEARKLETLDPERMHYALFRAYAACGYVAGALGAIEWLDERLSARLSKGGMSDEWEPRIVEMFRFLRQWESSQPWAEKLDHWSHGNPTWVSLRFEWFRWLHWLKGEAVALSALERYEPEPKNIHFGLAYARYLHENGQDGQAHIVVLESLKNADRDDVEIRSKAAKFLLEIGSHRAALRLLKPLVRTPELFEDALENAHEIPGLEENVAAWAKGSVSPAPKKILAAGRYLVSVRQFTEAENLLKKLEGTDFETRLVRIALLRLLADSGADYKKRGEWIKTWGDEATAAFASGLSLENELRLLETFPQTRHKVSAQVKYLQALDRISANEALSLFDRLSLVSSLMDARRVDRAKKLLMSGLDATLSKPGSPPSDAATDEALVWLSAVFRTVEANPDKLPTSSLTNQLKRDLARLVPPPSGRDLSQEDISRHFLTAKLLYDLGDHQQARNRIEALVTPVSVKNDEKNETKPAPQKVENWRPDPLDTAVLLSTMTQRFVIKPEWEEAIETTEDFDRLILRWRLWLICGRIEQAQNTHYLLRQNLSDAPLLARRLSAAFQQVVSDLTFSHRKPPVILDVGLMHLYHAVRLARLEPSWNRMEEIALLVNLQGDPRIDDPMQARRFRLALWTMEGEIEEWIFKRFNLPSKGSGNSEMKPDVKYWELYELIMQLENTDYLEVLSDSVPINGDDPKMGWEVVQALGLRYTEQENDFFKRLEPWMDSVEDAELLLNAALLVDAMIDRQADALETFRSSWITRKNWLEKAEKRLEKLVPEIVPKGQLVLERDPRIHDHAAREMKKQLETNADALLLCFQKHGGDRRMEFRLDLSCTSEGLPDRLLFRDLEKDEYPVRTCLEPLIHAMHFEKVEPPFGFTRVMFEWTPTGGEGQSLRFQSSIDAARSRLNRDAKDWKQRLSLKEADIERLEETKARLLDWAYTESLSPLGMSRFARWMSVLSPREDAEEKRAEAFWLAGVYGMGFVGLVVLTLLWRRKRKQGKER